MFRYFSILILLVGFNAFGQRSSRPFPKDSVESDTIEKQYMIIAGDSIPREAIDLEEVVLLRKLKFNSSADRKRYLILRRKTRKVYPYAKLASERLVRIKFRLDDIKIETGIEKSIRRLYRIILKMNSLRN